MLHKDTLAGDVHSLANWVVANEAARLALTLMPEDLYKFCYQVDNTGVYVLTDDSPATWVLLNSASVVPAAGGVGQILVKTGAGDYVMAWTNPPPYPITHIVRNAVQSITNAGYNLVTWDAAITNEAAAWSAGTNPSRLTIPSGYTKARISFQVAWASNSTGVRAAKLAKNAADTNIAVFAASSLQEQPVGRVGPWMTVTPGDYFQLYVYQSSGGPLNLSGSAVLHGPSWINLELGL